MDGPSEGDQISGELELVSCELSVRCSSNEVMAYALASGA